MEVRIPAGAQKRKSIDLLSYNPFLSCLQISSNVSSGPSVTPEGTSRRREGLDPEFLDLSPSVSGTPVVPRSSKHRITTFVTCLRTQKGSSRDSVCVLTKRGNRGEGVDTGKSVSILFTPPLWYDSVFDRVLSESRRSPTHVSLFLSLVVIPLHFFVCFVRDSVCCNVFYSFPPLPSLSSFFLGHHKGSPRPTRPRRSDVLRVPGRD